jgi:hypothetical protein
VLIDDFVSRKAGIARECRGGLDGSKPESTSHLDLGLAAHEDRSLCPETFQPSRKRDSLTHDAVAGLLTGPHLTCYHAACAETCTERNVAPTGRAAGTSAAVTDLQCCTYGARCIVASCQRRAEHGHDAVSESAQDGPAVTMDDLVGAA